MDEVDNMDCMDTMDITCQRISRYPMAAAFGSCAFSRRILRGEDKALEKNGKSPFVYDGGSGWMHVSL